MPTAPRKPAWIVNILMVAMLPCYVGLYALNVRQIGVGVGIGPPPWPKESGYRVGGKAAKFIFWPIETIDRRVRPVTWTNENYYGEFGGDTAE
jgi:hypothetical protein